MAKFYAVRKGRKTGIFKTWQAVKPLVDGFFNAEFQQFNNIYDATDFMSKKDVITTVMDRPTESAITSYIGGAVNTTTNQIAACALMRDGFVIHHQDVVLRNMSNDHGLYDVGGQLLGIMLAIQRAIDLYATSLECYVDEITYYWLQKPDLDNDLFQKYQQLVDQHRKHLKITLTVLSIDDDLMQTAHLNAYDQIH